MYLLLSRNESRQSQGSAVSVEVAFRVIVMSHYLFAHICIADKMIPENRNLRWLLQVPPQFLHREWLKRLPHPRNYQKYILICLCLCQKYVAESRMITLTRTACECLKCCYSATGLFETLTSWLSYNKNNNNVINGSSRVSQMASSPDTHRKHTATLSRGSSKVQRLHHHNPSPTNNHSHQKHHQHQHHSLFMIGQDVNGLGGLCSVRIKKDLEQQQRCFSRCGLPPRVIIILIVSSDRSSLRDDGLIYCIYI